MICGQLAVLFKTYVEEQAELAREEEARAAAQARLDEEQARADADRKAAEEARQKAAEEKAAEEARQFEEQQQAEEQARLAAEQQAQADAEAAQARQTAHRQLILRLACVGVFCAAVIAGAVILIRKLHKAGKC